MTPTPTPPVFVNKTNHGSIIDPAEPVAGEESKCTVLEEQLKQDGFTQPGHEIYLWRSLAYELEAALGKVESRTPPRPGEVPWLPPELREFLATIPKLTADELARLEAGVKRIMPEVLAEIEQEPPASAAREWDVWCYRAGPLQMAHNATSDEQAEAIGWRKIRVREVHPVTPQVPEFRYFLDRRNGNRWKMPLDGSPGYQWADGEWLFSQYGTRLEMVLDPYFWTQHGTIETDAEGRPLP